LLQSLLSAQARYRNRSDRYGTYQIEPKIAHACATQISRTFIHRYQTIALPSHRTAMQLLQPNGHEPRSSCKTYIDGIIPNEELISTQQNGAK
jgi:hypothetical protein